MTFLLSLFTGIGCKILGIGAMIAGTLGAVFAIREDGVKAAEKDQQVATLKQEQKDRATVDTIEATVAKPGAPPAAEQLQQQFSRD